MSIAGAPNVGIRPSAREDGTASLSLTTARVAEEADPRSAVSVALRANMGEWLGWLVSPLFSLLSFVDCRRPPILLCDFHALPHGMAPGWAVICLLLPRCQCLCHTV